MGGEPYPGLKDDSPQEAFVTRMNLLACGSWDRRGPSSRAWEQLGGQLDSGGESTPGRPVSAHLSLEELCISFNLYLPLLGPGMPLLCGRPACSSSPLPHIPPPGSPPSCQQRATPHPARAELEPLGGHSQGSACFMAPSLSDSPKEPGTGGAIVLTLHNAVMPG